MNKYIVEKNENEYSKYVMYYGVGENPLRIVYDSKELFEETLYDMTENFLKDTLSRISRIKGTEKIRRGHRLIRLASVIFDRRINSIEDIADLMSLKIKKEKLPN